MYNSQKYSIQIFSSKYDFLLPFFYMFVLKGIVCSQLTNMFLSFPPSLPFKVNIKAFELLFAWSDINTRDKRGSHQKIMQLLNRELKQSQWSSSRQRAVVRDSRVLFLLEPMSRCKLCSKLARLETGQQLDQGRTQSWFHFWFSFSEVVAFWGCLGGLNVCMTYFRWLLRRLI